MICSVQCKNTLLQHVCQNSWLDNNLWFARLKRKKTHLCHNPLVAYQSYERSPCFKHKSSINGPRSCILHIIAYLCWVPGGYVGFPVNGEEDTPPRSSVSYGKDIPNSANRRYMPVHLVPPSSGPMKCTSNSKSDPINWSSGHMWPDINLKCATSFEEKSMFRPCWAHVFWLKPWRDIGGAQQGMLQCIVRKTEGSETWPANLRPRTADGKPSLAWTASCCLGTSFAQDPGPNTLKMLWGLRWIEWVGLLFCQQRIGLRVRDSNPPAEYPAKRKRLADSFSDDSTIMGLTWLSCKGHTGISLFAPA